MVIIRSCSSDRELRISCANDACLLAELIGFPVSAKVEVWAEPGDAAELHAFFADLGKQERPWSGTREWQSIEGDFKLCATCNALGSVVFKVELHGLQGATEKWAVTAGLDYELGQLHRLLQSLGPLQPG